jgi:hypothetical protein
MLLHQRIDFTATPSGTLLEIPTSATLWTAIECRSEDNDVRSHIFPSRIIAPDKKLSVIFAGVDTSGLLQLGHGIEYRMVWKIVADIEDPNPQNQIFLPLGRDVTFTYSHGNSTFLSLSLGGIDIQLDFNNSTRILTTSWFKPQLTSSWTLNFPRLLLANVFTKIWKQLTIQDHEEPTKCCFLFRCPSITTDTRSREAI